MSELILKEDALNCFHDWIDRYGYEHTADEDPVYQMIAELKSIEDCDDAISRRMAIEVIDEWFKKVVRRNMSAYEYDSAYAQGEIDAYVTAINTLKTLPAVQPDHNADIGKKVEGDCISRQAAIDLFPDDDLEYDTKGGYVAPHLARRMICELPSAQPDLSEYSDKLWQKAYERGKAEAQAEIVRCKDCRFNTYSKKCLNPDSFFLVPADDFYCGYAERRTDEQTKD